MDHRPEGWHGCTREIPDIHGVSDAGRRPEATRLGEAEAARLLRCWDFSGGMRREERTSPQGASAL